MKKTQSAFTAHIRNPAAPAPAGIEARRMKIYRDLIYNTIEGFLKQGFPVLRSLHRDGDWHHLVRRFVSAHRCETPYFTEISQEFLRFLMDGGAADSGEASGEAASAETASAAARPPGPASLPFLVELAHYEWVELALDVAAEEIDGEGGEDGDAPGDGLHPHGDVLAGAPALSPLVWSLRYSFPVHRIGPSFQPAEPPVEPTYLAVYRNRADQVKFLEINAATARLLELLRENTGDAAGQSAPVNGQAAPANGQAPVSGQALLEQLAGEMKADNPAAIVEFGARTLRQFQELDILCGARPVVEASHA